MSNTRVAVASLTVSFAAFVGWAVNEGYTNGAIIPTRGDVPTYGYGSTKHVDGTPVKLGEHTDPVRALVTAKAHVEREEAVFRKSIDGASLTQDEFDVYMDWVYQYGSGAWTSSTMRKEIMAGRYAQACDALLLYKRSAGFDCSTPGNKVCAGVWVRQLERNAKCKAAI